MAFLKSRTGHDSWNGAEDDLRPTADGPSWGSAYSAVVHDIVAETLSEMRQEREAMVVFQCRVLTGPRNFMVDLARSAEGNWAVG